MVVTDLHGAWEPYRQYRDAFLGWHARGEVERLLFLGDLIHSNGPPESDASLAILLDLLALRDDLGPDTVLMLPGNHELPHLYSVPFSLDGRPLSPRFQHSLGEYRPGILAFLSDLPFLIRTRAGVMLTHAGASAAAAQPEAAARLLRFSHQDLLAEAASLLERQDVQALVEDYLEMPFEHYADAAYEWLAVAGPDDPRYFDLLRGFIVSSLEPEWSLLWDFFFTGCEAEIGLLEYAAVLERFLAAFSAAGEPQRVLVAGHRQARGGAEIIAGRQLRLASWTHAVPREAGCCLLFDAGCPVSTPEQLLPGLRPLR